MSGKNKYTKKMWAEYRRENKQRLSEYRKKWREKNLAELHTKEKGRYWANPGKAREIRRQWHHRVRFKIIDLLGGKCILCGFNDWRALQVDHKNGGGCKDRKNIAHSPSALQKKILESIERGEDKYQLLCANCNWIKRYENYELNKI